MAMTLAEISVGGGLSLGEQMAVALLLVMIAALWLHHTFVLVRGVVRILCGRLPMSGELIDENQKGK